MTEFTSMLLVYFISFGPPQGKSEVALATYKYSGAEAALKAYADTYPKGVRVFVAQSAVGVASIGNRYIQYTWGF